MNILIIQTAYLGDVILTTPLIGQVRCAYPESRISILVIPQTADILNRHKDIDEIIIYDKRKWGCLISKTPGLIRNVYNKFDIAISPHLSARSAIIALMSGARIRVGFEKSAFKQLYTQRAIYGCGHIVERYANLIKSLGFEIPPDKITLGVDKSDIMRANDILKGARDKNAPLVGIFPQSEWFTKTPPLPLLKTAIKSTLKEIYFHPVFLGSRADNEISIFSKEVGGIDLMGKTDLNLLKGIVSMLDVVISGDSSGVHIASAFLKPTIVIYGATRPGQGYYPWMNEYYAIMADISCAPCSPHGGNKCPQGHFNCMNNIRPESISNRLLDIIKHSKL